MTSAMLNLKTLPVRIFAKFLSFFSNLWLGNERARLNLLINSLPKPATNLQKRTLASEPCVLIIIPFRDKWQLTDKCISSLVHQEMGDQKIKVLLLNNNSIEAETLENLPRWKMLLTNKRIECEIMDDNSPFNFSALNNRAAERASANFSADVVLFLNNDIEFTNSKQLAEWSCWHQQQTNVGISGATLLYPNHTIQHSCVLPGFKIVAAHPLRYFSEAVANEWCEHARCVPAVTGAALMIQWSIFQQLDGFDEALAHACQDVDLCLKSLKAGYENWVAPNVKLIHHESATRKAEHKPAEVKYFYSRWENEIEELCKVSKKISRWNESPSLSFGEGTFPWRSFQ